MASFAILLKGAVKALPLQREKAAKNSTQWKEEEFIVNHWNDKKVTRSHPYVFYVLFYSPLIN